MLDRELHRRDFTRLTMAAFGGLVVGTGAASASAQGKDDKKNPLLYEPHICRGLNTCKGKAKGKENACAGQGACATVEAHACKGENDCRGQGGCGAKPGENACKGMGGCEVPLGKEETWKKARKRFEEVMAADGRKVGPAPKKS